MKPRLEEWLLLRFGWRCDLPGYFDLLALSILLGWMVLIWYTRRSRLSERVAYTFTLFAVPLLFLGAKIAFFLQFPEAAGRGWAFWLGSGAALYGGLGGIVAAALMTSWVHGVSFIPYLDGLALGLALGLTTGRLGCFMAGCNHGRITELPWGVRFPPGSHAFRQQVELGLLAGDARLSLPVHPTQLYESAGGLLLLCIGVLLLRAGKNRGAVFATLLGSYAFLRFQLEWLRADQGGGSRLFSFAQWLSGLTLLLVLVFYSYRSTRQTRVRT